MAEKIVSPGVFTKEIDATFLPAAVGQIGACIIGPTFKGPGMIPTTVNSMAEFENMFGTSFSSGSGKYEYFTSLAAREYLRGGNSATIIRTMAGSYSPAIACVTTASSTHTLGTNTFGSDSLALKNARITHTGETDGVVVMTLETISDGRILNSSSSCALPSGQLGDPASINVSSSLGKYGALTLMDTDGPQARPTTATDAPVGGNRHNLRWEVSQRNVEKGTFTLLIRRGDDTDKNKQILETWTNLSLDPKENNYVEKVIGNQDLTIQTDSDSVKYIQAKGTFINKSKYVRVKSVNLPTPDYLDQNGEVSDLKSILSGYHQSSSIPSLGSGSLGGAFHGGNDGDFETEAANFFEDATMGATANNFQGFDMAASSVYQTAYTDALDLIANQDEYDVNLIMTPGVIDGVGAGTTIVSKAIDVAEDRGDCFYVYNSTVYGDAITTSTSTAAGRNTSYAATYYPWVQVAAGTIGKNVWVPPDVVIPGVLAFNDRVSHPWFAPAGLNRGGIDSAVQAERKLTQANRDTLYDSNVNPIATFPGQGVTVFGQKTLQKKASALDRINVRRLLISVKKFIASASRFLVFEQNTSATRQRVLNIANPYLERVQSQSGLNAFKVVMDETNNTPDTIDRNQLVGQLFLQPTRTAEFIVLDFTILPTGAAFPE